MPNDPKTLMDAFQMHTNSIKEYISENTSKVSVNQSTNKLEIDGAETDIGNFKAVSTTANQNLSSEEQAAARANIGAGTSNISNSSLAQLVDNGAKNLISNLRDSATQAGITAIRNGDDSLNVTWSATGSSNEYCRLNDDGLTLPIGTYVFSGITETSNSTYHLHLEDSAGNVIGNTTSSNQPLEFTVTSTTVFYKIYVAVSANTAAQSTPKVIYPMICIKPQFDISPAHEPHALGNQYLTPALIQQVDGGAKNKLDFASATIAAQPNATASKSSDNLVASCTVDWAYVSLSVGKFTGNCTLSFKISDLSNTGASPNIRIGKNQDGSSPVANISFSANGTYSGNFVGDGSNYFLIVYLNPSGTAQTVNLKISEVMVCTLADWNASHKFVPYRPSYDAISSVSPFYSVPINHNMIYRGQNLGASLTDAQHTALSSGNFTDLYLGDYWTKSVSIPAFYEVTTAEPANWSTNYTSYYTKSGDTYTAVSGASAPTWAANTYYERQVLEQTVTLKAAIADFDTFYAGYASTYAGINTHHAAVIVHGFNNVVWNKTNTTAGGYVNSLIHKWLVNSALPQIETWFGAAKVLSHQKLLTNAITGDAASGWAWSSQKISLLSENQLYGSKVWGGSKATNGGYEPGEAFKHLNVFNHIDANLLFGNRNIWCRDIASAVGAARLNVLGYAHNDDASNTWFAPAALILLS